MSKKSSLKWGKNDVYPNNLELQVGGVIPMSINKLCDWGERT